MLHGVGAEQPAVVRPLACRSMFDAVLIRGCRDELFRFGPMILPAMFLATAIGILDLQIAVAREETQSDPLFAEVILDPRWASVIVFACRLSPCIRRYGRYIVRTIHARKACCHSDLREYIYLSYMGYTDEGGLILATIIVMQ